MSATITYPDTGRGAWPSKGHGGTIAAKGMEPGRYFRAPAPGAPKSLLRVGLLGFRANRDSTAISINEYAVYRACMWLQERFGTDPDGIWGSATDEKVKAWQARQALVPDGVFGPRSARALLLPEVRAVAEAHNGHPQLSVLMTGHIAYESGWDPAAVGVIDSRDLGLCQINGTAHPTLSEDTRLNPTMAMRWMAEFVIGNLDAMHGNVRDAVAAYNLGRGGARSWIADGRPEVWQREGKPPVYVKRYIDAVLAA